MLHASGGDLNECHHLASWPSAHREPVEGEQWEGGGGLRAFTSLQLPPCRVALGCLSTLPRQCVHRAPPPESWGSFVLVSLRPVWSQLHLDLCKCHAIEPSMLMCHVTLQGLCLVAMMAHTGARSWSALLGHQVCACTMLRAMEGKGEFTQLLPSGSFLYSEHNE